MTGIQFQPQPQKEEIAEQLGETTPKKYIARNSDIYRLTELLLHWKTKQEGKHNIQLDYRGRPKLNT